jgi:hypothetical protein
MSIGGISGGSFNTVIADFFVTSNDDTDAQQVPGTYTDLLDIITTSVTETANDGSATDAYSSLFSASAALNSAGNFTLSYSFDVPKSFFIAHAGTTLTFDIAVVEFNPLAGVFDDVQHLDVGIALQGFDAPTISNDYLAITRTVLPVDQAVAEAKAINAFTTTEAQFVSGLLPQVANTTIPAVAVEGSMYAAVGTSDEVTKLATQFLPAQVENAIQNHFDPQVYACEALGLAFAFSDENGGKAFADDFGPSGGMPATPEGDANFANAAAAIFGSAANENTAPAILNFVSNWEAFYSSHGIPGVANATADQIVLAARGAAWGDAVGVALANNLGPLPGLTTNFLKDAAQGTANYGASLYSGQPLPGPFEGEVPGANPATGAQLVGVAVHADHIV